MSEAPQSARERSYAEPERDATPYARCARQARDDYSRLYLGTQRPPRLPDERGALAVIECVFGGRIRIYLIAGDPDHRRIEHDRDWRAATHAAGAQAGNAQPKAQGGLR